MGGGGGGVDPRGGGIGGGPELGLDATALAEVAGLFLGGSAGGGESDVSGAAIGVLGGGRGGSSGGFCTFEACIE